MRVYNNNDIVIVGRRWNINYPAGEYRDFYLKIKSDGTITSTKGISPEELMVVYPNPTQGELNINIEMNKLQDIDYTICKEDS